MAIVKEFLSSILSFLKSKDAEKLKLWLRVEPPLPDSYTQLAKELKASFRDSRALDKFITTSLPETGNDAADQGDVWPGFLSFMQEYLEFWRDVDFDDLVQTHLQLSSLTHSCITAMSNPTYGSVLLPTAIQISSALAKLAVTLDKRPDLRAKLQKIARLDQGESRKTLVESTAECIQRGFTICLTERSASRNGIGKDGKPEGKKVGIYIFANLVLKLLFQCRKTRLANQLFTNITQHSPPLTLYPASQRVTYLYYLGRFYFSNGHFYSAQRCLQSAYDQSHARCLSQRRLILIYLISANCILGRFPSPTLFSRPEASGLESKFRPISEAIKKGDIVSFKKALGSESGNERWFFQKGVFLPLISRCEILVWRSLARRVFLLTFDGNGWDQRQTPTLELDYLLAATHFTLRILEGWQVPGRVGAAHMNSIFLKRPSIIPPSNGPRVLAPYEGAFYANKVPEIIDMEAIVASLVQQGLLHGFMSQNHDKFAILGSKQRGGPLNAGFPNVWDVLRAKAVKENRASDVPGWVTSEKAISVGGVVNLSGIARPVGSGS